MPDDFDPILDWRYPGPDVIPTTDFPDGHMPDMLNESRYGKRDGHDTRASHLNSLRDMCIDNRLMLRQWRTWNYIQVAQPTGMATPAEALWQFTDYTNGILDRTGNGHTLSYGGAWASVYQRIEDITCLGFNEGNYVQTTSPGNLRITGALTIEVIAQLQDISGINDMMVNCGATGETEATNFLYQWFTQANTGRMTYVAEYGAGANTGWTSPVMMNCGSLQHYVMTRTATGDISFWVNGYLAAGPQNLVTPTGGSSAYFRFGSNISGGSQVFHGYIAACKVTAAEFNAAQILEAYETANRVVT